jgi:hypothetical protein
VVTLAEGVTGFAATPDGRRLALARGAGAAGEIWVLERSSGELWQLTDNDLAEGTLSWAPDGLSLAYSSAPTAAPTAPDWLSWGEWCTAAEARVLDLPAAPGAGPAVEERTLGAGCEPAFGPDGRRIVFTGAPARAGDVPTTRVDNTLVMVNRQGANGWNVAIADGVGPDQGGLLVYGPAWSPDAEEVGYQRFLGYQALVDINLTETSSSSERSGAPVGLGAGWMLAPRYSPDGRLLAVTEYNFSDARGFTGYDTWSTAILRLGESTQMALPSGEVTMEAVEIGGVRRASAAAWSPDGAALVLALPAGWQPEALPNEELFPGAGPAELWRWPLGEAPQAKLADGVDFGSPLLWLPAAPSVAANEAEVALAVPAGWGLREPAAADYWVADGPGGAVVAARLVAGGPPGPPERLFLDLLPTSVVGDPVSLPDGSIVRGLQGLGPGGARLAGAMRISADEQAVAVYLTTPERWPLERGLALGLLAASGR